MRRKISILSGCSTCMQFHGFVRSTLIGCVVVGLFCMFLISACGDSPLSSTPPSTPHPAQATVAVTPMDRHIAMTSTAVQTQGVSIKIYFSKFNSANDRIGAVYPVLRVAHTNAVATYAIQQLIAGPTADERTAGYSSMLQTALTGISMCAKGQDFVLSLNKKVANDELGTTTIKFCRMLVSAGIGTDAAIKAEVVSTLEQFATIKKVIVLNKDGHCFGDESGADICLR